MKKLLVILLLIASSAKAETYILELNRKQDSEPKIEQKQEFNERQLQSDRRQEYQNEFNDSLAASMRVYTGQAKDYSEAVRQGESLRDQSRFDDRRLLDLGVGSQHSR